MLVSIIAAIGKNRELGKDNKLLWHIPEDFKRMSKITSGHPIIMGRKTWESLPTKPLADRYNIVITRDQGFKIDGSKEGESFAVVNSLEKGIERARKAFGADEIFIFGGGQIYKEALEKNLVDKLYLTIVDANSDADTFFPDYSQFKKVVFEKPGKLGKYKYKFLDLEKQLTL